MVETLNCTTSVITLRRLRAIINRYFGSNNNFQIKEGVACSELVKSEDYQSAIKVADLDSLVKLIELTRLQDACMEKLH